MCIAVPQKQRISWNKLKFQLLSVIMLPFGGTLFKINLWLRDFLLFEALRR